MSGDWNPFNWGWFNQAATDVDNALQKVPGLGSIGASTSYDYNPVESYSSYSFSPAAAFDSQIIYDYGTGIGDMGNWNSHSGAGWSADIGSILDSANGGIAANDGGGGDTGLGWDGGGSDDIASLGTALQEDAKVASITPTPKDNMMGMNTQTEVAPNSGIDNGPGWKNALSLPSMSRSNQFGLQNSGVTPYRSDAQPTSDMGQFLKNNQNLVGGAAAGLFQGIGGYLAAGETADAAEKNMTRQIEGLKQRDQAQADRIAANYGTPGKGLLTQSNVAYAQQQNGTRPTPTQVRSVVGQDGQWVYDANAGKIIFQPTTQAAPAAAPVVQGP